ncbi:MAG: glucose 1-dehydrogenase [Firmicutes bacterium]|nr:glucose 1-dehydrogenase [Bacillota bacterium]
MILDDFKLDGQVAYVTGASRGLGRAMAEALAEAGAGVALAALPSEEEAMKDVARYITSLGRKCLTIGVDLSGVEAAVASVDTVITNFGRLDILVNNAGMTRRRVSIEHTVDDWDAVMNLNSRTVFFMAQAAAKHMLARGSGKIINTASMLSFQGGRGVPSYTASKGAVASITRALANEWAGKGVNVNAIAPGYMRTDLNTALMNDPVRSQQILGRIPAGRWGEPADLKGAVVFLASRASNYLSGHILCVDGGWLSS